ncbi:unnamed protein product [Notodromas monacha]|uniref:Myosin motor domain-containing protein n=2 Tax=Notodromas monacha TaxID=399045 RepID=A0A7R9GHJ4_9CRUS|nr:unnamed protein product [Notodromas monacha]CAG0922973.1 unnamed protein product [Notodromas monacha]
MYLNEATLLNNVRLRYLKDKIYTYVGNILVAVNPYNDIQDLYSTQSISRYRGKSLGLLPPHVFAIADKAFRDMKVLSQSQSMIVSGESGAGKTESTKYILRYLCETGGYAAGPIEQRILDANPVLEAFGNAKTTRNSNSSRFGKFVEIHFSKSYGVVGGYISHYLLEKSRICSQNVDERNYHIFYQLCSGAPAELKMKMGLGNPEKFHVSVIFSSSLTRILKMPLVQYLVNRGSKTQHTRNLRNDASDFVKIDKALDTLGISAGDRQEIYTIVAAVLHLGNIEFENDVDDSHGGSRLTPASLKSLEEASRLMKLDVGELKLGLAFRTMQTACGDVINVPLKPREAASARDALAKSMYSRLFDNIVSRINASIPFQTSAFYIGVLDIAGFEYFPKNGFEQFCINYCNEKLQTFFNERVLHHEQILYAQEGLQVPRITYADNSDCIQLVEDKMGVIDLLNEEGKLPKPDACHFTAAVHKNLHGHFRLELPRCSKLRQHRELRDDEGFIIRHFAGAVCYETAQFIEKNNDALHSSLEALVCEAKNHFLKSLFETVDQPKRSGKLNYVSVASKFRGQLNELMEKLQSTGTSFIRCIKPNGKMAPKDFDGGGILSQLQCAGMGSVLKLMQQGYPSRTGFQSLHEMYKQYLPGKLARLDARLFCKALFKALGLNDTDFKFGVSKVFFRAGKFAEFDQMLKSDPENLAALVDRVKQWLLRSRWKKVQWGAIMVIKLTKKIEYRRENLIVMQKMVRMHQARKQHQPRYTGISRLKKLQAMHAFKRNENIIHLGLPYGINLDHMQRIASELKANRENSLSIVANLDRNLMAAITKIKTDDKILRSTIEADYVEIVTRVNKELILLDKKLEQQKTAEEQEKLRRIQEQMEADRKREEEEKLRVAEEATMKRKKSQIEVQRRLEEEEVRQLEAQAVKAEAERETIAARHRLNTTQFASMSVEEAMAKAIEEDSLARQQLEQERRDRELALRLAREMGVQVIIPCLFDEEVAANQWGSGAASPVKTDPTKYDLTKWKYSDLRDAINTSCDVDLLEVLKALSE